MTTPHPNPAQTPHQGEAVPVTKKGSKKGLLIAALAAILIIGGCAAFAIGNDDDETAPETTPTTTFVETETATSEVTPMEEATTTPATQEAEEVPADFTDALNKAQGTVNDQNLSEAALRDYLISEEGGKFSPEAAEYAVSNVEADWNANALAKAKAYAEGAQGEALSPAGIYDELISEYGDKFTTEQAQYAIDHL